MFFRGCNDPTNTKYRSPPVWRFRKRHTGGERYFVFVGSLHPRKNIEGLMNAFGQYVDRGGLRHLVIVGAAMWDELPMDLLPSVRRRTEGNKSMGSSSHMAAPTMTR